MTLTAVLNIHFTRPFCLFTYLY